MEIVPVDSDNQHVYANLAQAYECEFSPLTGKSPDLLGLFAPDTVLGGDVRGFLLYLDNRPAGFAAVRVQGAARYEVCEFFVVPLHRRQRHGSRFAHALWRFLPGRWEVKQLAAAGHATRFWRQAIAGVKGAAYTEDWYEDPYWGRVMRQVFGFP